MSEGLKLGDHPRAQRQIRQGKAYGALIGFAVTIWFGYRAQVPFADMTLRAVLVGVISYVLAWAVVVAVWRQVARAELELARRRLLSRLETIDTEHQK